MIQALALSVSSALGASYRTTTILTLHVCSVLSDLTQILTRDTGATGRVSIWSTAEPCLGIVAACLPTMRPLVGRVIAKCSKFSSGSYLSRMRDRRSMNNQSSDNSYGSAANRSRNFQRIPGLESDPSTNTQICSVKDDVRDSNHNIREIPLHVIEVETRTSWEDHQKQSDYTGSTKRM